MIKTRKTEYKPDFVSPPGETLQETLDMLCLSQADLANRTGRPKKTINEIIQGKAAITPDTAMQLELVLNVPASFWLMREAKYRVWLAQQEEDQRIDKEADLLKKLPVKDMVKLGWIEESSSKRDTLKRLLTFLGIVSADKLPLVEQAAFRQSDKFAVNQWALAAWLRKGELEAQKIQSNSYNSDEFIKVLHSARALTLQEPNIFVPELVKLCAKAGVCLVFVNELPKISVSGATRWMSQDKPMIQMSLRHKCNDMFWFTFFHEAGHVYLEHTKREVLLEDKFEDNLDPREVLANKFATDLLIPKTQIADFISKGNYSKDSIKKFANHVRVAPGIVVGRLQFEKKLEWNRFRELKKSFSWDEWPQVNGYCQL